MAIFHLSAKVISRGNGSSAVAAAAYRSASRLHDERLDRAHDFTNKAGVVWSEVLLPPGAPKAWRDREVLWNAVEAAEVRKDAQLAREVEFALPRELTREEGVELARDFVRREFVDRGMVADLNVHWDIGADGEAKPHAHVMLALREVRPDGFGPKVRGWNRTELLKGWREAWADRVNEALAERGIDATVDHRSLRAQGIDLEPQGKIGAAAGRRQERGEDAERIAEHRDIARRNGERILADPRLALDAVTRQQATFTRWDLARFLHRHTDGAEQFTWALAAVEASPERVRLGRDGRGDQRFTSREMVGVEQALANSAETLAERRDHGVSGRGFDAAARRNAERGFVPSREQVTALAHVAQPNGLSVVVGYAGAGKSAMLDMARTAWEADGRRVQGAALSGMAAENLTAGSGIEARTLASLEHSWDRGRDLLQPGDVLVVDEAGLVGSRQLQRVLGAVEAAGAKAVLVGDAEQLQAIEAGAAFRVLGARHGAAELKSVRRQVEPWQQQATRHLATGRTQEALAAYAAHGAAQNHETTEAALGAMVDGWDRHRKARPDESRLLMAHTRADVAALNEVARARLRDAGELGGDHAVSTERGRRTFAAGDRIMFLRNERSLGVRNGSLGSVEDLSASAMFVRLDDGRRVSFDLKDYVDLDHGYATTIHKAQGATVDRAWVLATPGLDRHATYVAMSRHRAGVSLHWSSGDFRNAGDLARRLGRERAKDSTLDYPMSAPDVGRLRSPVSREGDGAQPAWRPLRERDRGRER